MSTHLNDPQVRATTFETSDAPPDCDHCGARNAGVNAVHWRPTEEPFGLLNVCAACLDTALSTALDDAPLDSEITVERLIRPLVLETAA